MGRAPLVILSPFGRRGFLSRGLFQPPPLLSCFFFFPSLERDAPRGDSSSVSPLRVPEGHDVSQDNDSPRSFPATLLPFSRFGSQWHPPHEILRLRPFPARLPALSLDDSVSGQRTQGFFPVRFLRYPLSFSLVFSLQNGRRRLDHGGWGLRNFFFVVSASPPFLSILPICKGPFLPSRALSPPAIPFFLHSPPLPLKECRLTMLRPLNWIPLPRSRGLPQYVLLSLSEGFFPFFWFALWFSLPPQNGVANGFFFFFFLFSVGLDTFFP